MIYGTAPAFLIARSWEDLAEGAMFSDRDIAASDNACVIGQTVKRELFGYESPIGKEIRLGTMLFRVCGVLSRKGPNIIGMDQDDTILAPWTTVKFRFNSINPGISQTSTNSAPDRVDQILVKASSRKEVPEAIAQITDLLRQRHRIKAGQADDFKVRDQNEANAVMQILRNPLNPPAPGK
jgi:ABC-type antimicrobial peptide transport system permease subunit